MKSNWIIPIGALCVGLAGGYVAGNAGSPAIDKEGSQAELARTRSQEREGAAREPGARKPLRNIDSAQIARLPAGFSRTQSLVDYYGGLAMHQFEQEATKLESLPPTERILASYLLFARWGESDPLAAMNFANTMGFSGMLVRPTVLQSWAAVDPSNAAKYYQENPREFAMMGMFGGGGRGRGMGVAPASSIIATEWAKQDPSAALQWAQSLTTEKSDAVSSVIGQIAADDPERATGLLAGLSAEERSGSYRTVASSYGAKNFSAAKAWIETLPVEDRQAALSSAIGGLSRVDPMAAAGEVAKLEAGPAKDQAVENVIEDLARVDPQSAAQLLKEQASDNALRESMRDLMPSWVAKDPAAALQFANSYQPGPIRDSAIQSYVWSNRTGTPGELIQLAESITDEGDRYRTVGMAAMRWMREDAEAAKAYIQQSQSLPDDAKQRIMDGRGFWGGRGRDR